MKRLEHMTLQEKKDFLQRLSNAIKDLLPPGLKYVTVLWEEGSGKGGFLTNLPGTTRVHTLLQNFVDQLDSNRV